MEDEIKTYVLKEEVSRSNIRRLSTLTSDNRMAVLSLISPLKLGENRLREVLALLEEISSRNQCTAGEIVSQPEIQAVLFKRTYSLLRKRSVSKGSYGSPLPEVDQ
jgi:hypothetical protein